jgi:hypothetical protein
MQEEEASLEEGSRAGFKAHPVLLGELRRKNAINDME